MVTNIAPVPSSCQYLPTMGSSGPRVDAEYRLSNTSSCRRFPSAGVTTPLIAAFNPLIFFADSIISSILNLPAGRTSPTRLEGVPKSRVRSLSDSSKPSLPASVREEGLTVVVLSREW